MDEENGWSTRLLGETSRNATSIRKCSEKRKKVCVICNRKNVLCEDHFQCNLYNTITDYTVHALITIKVK